MICKAELPELICYTFGYGGRQVEDLASVVEQYDGTIIDVRLKPWTRQPGWSLSELKKRFGDQYHWWRCLGNVNVKTGGKPKLQDAKKGLALLVKLIETTSPILLCGERNPWICHRRLIAERLQKQTGCRIVHLPVLERPAPRPSPQLALPLGTIPGHIPPSRQANASKRSQKRKRK